MKSALTLLISLIICATASAQRIVGELEANTDMLMTPDDSLNSPTDNKKKDKKEVPVDIRTWNIDNTYGNRQPTYVDTLAHQIHNHNLAEGINGHYNPLGNLGAPRLNHIFMERRNIGGDFIFLRTFDQFYVEPDQFRYYNTKSPYLNVCYDFCGSKNTGDDHVKVTYTNNVNRNINFGGLFDYMYGQGYYDSQSTSYMGSSAWVSYIGDTYDMHLQYTHNHMKLAENGGITDENYITHPENMERSYASSDIPTWLGNTWSKQEHDVIHLNHRYHIGFYRTVGDSASQSIEFVPVTSIFHTLDLQYLRRAYIAYDTPEYYHTHDNYAGLDTTDDRTKDLLVRNVVGLSLREGFNRYAQAGLNAYVAFEHQSFEMPDSIQTPLSDVARFKRKQKQSENTVSIGGQIIRTQGHTLHYNINAELGLTGAHSGDMKLEADGHLNIPLLGDTASLQLRAYIHRQTPAYYIRHYHSRHAWWDFDTDKETRTHMSAQLSWEKTRTTLNFAIENLKNYTYFSNTGTQNPEGAPLPYSNNITPMQASQNIEVMSLTLLQDLKFGILHLDNDITFQTTTNRDVIPLPTLSLYHNIYLKFKYARVLGIEFGADLKYYTSYYMPDYSPIVSQFMTQNQANRVKIGNYPLISVYANFDLKRTRFYVQYYHANQSDGRYLWAPGYPINPKGLHMGINWNFYD
ncbi:MAG: putative porin [Bacteroidaceae bacterium]|nr:putative porin [Bacteroidaceae bacterium]